MISAKLRLFKAARFTFTQVSTQSHSGRFFKKEKKKKYYTYKHDTVLYNLWQQHTYEKTQEDFLYKRQIKVCLGKLSWNDAFIQWF